MSSSRKYSEGHTTQKVGNRSTQPRLYELHPIPAAICEKKWSNSINLQISQNEKKSSQQISHQHPGKAPEEGCLEYYWLAFRFWK